MSNLTNCIEDYIKRLLEISPSASIFLQRKELSERFSCVPSQINYVLATRFTPERGYVVETKRGGKGYLLIRRLDLSRERVVHLVKGLRGLVREGISGREAADLIDRLADARVITRREARLMRAAVHHETARAEDDALRCPRAAMLAAMLEALLRES